MTLREVFYTYCYYIAFRKKSITNNGDWTVIPSSLNNWYADPFLFEWSGRHFLFAERMNRWRLIGSIAVCEIRQDGSVTKFQEILTEPFHLSYPNIFEYAGEVYMIPESGWNKDIRLYRATNFPTKWKLEKVLFEGDNYVDTSFMTTIVDDSAILNSYDWSKRKSCFFEFDLKTMDLKRLPDNPLIYNERNGGNAFVKDGVSYRVLQDCTEHYGSKVMIRRIDNHDFANGKAVDSRYNEINPEDLSIDRALRPIWCHTYNQSAHLEVIDFMVERFDWFGPITSLRNKVFYESHKTVLGED